MPLYYYLILSYFLPDQRSASQRPGSYSFPVSLCIGDIFVCVRVYVCVCVKEREIERDFVQLLGLE